MLPTQLRHMDKSVHAAEIHECTKIDDRGDDPGPRLALVEIVQERGPLLGLLLFEIGPT